MRLVYVCLTGSRTHHTRDQASCFWFTEQTENALLFSVLRLFEHWIGHVGWWRDQTATYKDWGRTHFLTCHLHTIVPMIKSFIKPLDLLQQELCSTCHTRNPVHKNSAKDTEPESWLHKHTHKNTIKNKQTVKYFVILTSLCAKNLSKICLKNIIWTASDE